MVITTNLIRQEMITFLNKCSIDYPNIHNLISRLCNDCDNVLLFGGVIRDTLFKTSCRDIDIVVNMPKWQLQNFLVKYSYNYQENRFHGFKLIIDNKLLDIWSLDETWAFKNKLINTSINNLQYSTFFNIDSLLYDICTDSVYADKFLDCYYTQTLDIVLHDNPFPLLCVVRGVILKDKYSFIQHISKDLRQYIQNQLFRIESFYNLQAIQLSHYGYYDQNIGFKARNMN